MHGHNYTVEVIFEASALTPDSFVRDPIDYRRIELFIRRTFDRKNLNEIFAAEFEQDATSRICIAGQPRSEATQAAVDEALRTPSENIARCIFWRLSSDFPELVAVKVADNFDSWAEYRESK
jgi:6-pyruvoyl-tetrahydropterin synthase